MPRTPLIIANWKMNVSASEARTFAKKIAAYANTHALPGSLVVCPSSESLSDLCQILKAGKRVFLGAQNCAVESKGSFTGESSAASLAEVGCTYCIVGHSERRTLFSETDEIVAEKVAACLAVKKMTPILCVGESARERKEGLTEKVLTRQITAVLSVLALKDRARVVIAYEPIWAIGSGLAMSSDDVRESIGAIRTIVGKCTPTPVQIVYGGSVDSQNIQSLLESADGVLVGTASQMSQSLRALFEALKS